MKEDRSCHACALLVKYNAGKNNWNVAVNECNL